MMTDPIADMLARIRNASMAGLEQTTMPYSKVKEAIAKILKEEGYIAGVAKSEQDSKFNMSLTLKYNKKNKSVIKGLKRSSRPGRRYYVGYKEVPSIMNGFGVAIVSTSKGVMTGQRAKEQKMGGEVICEVW